MGWYHWDQCRISPTPPSRLKMNTSFFLILFLLTFSLRTIFKLSSSSSKSLCKKFISSAVLYSFISSANMRQRHSFTGIAAREGVLLSHFSHICSEKNSQLHFSKKGVYTCGRVDDHYSELKFRYSDLSIAKKYKTCIFGTAGD